ncbi:MAG: hypothetical protein AABX13_05510 [Nanoarchaeota archaeon]
MDKRGDANIWWIIIGAVIALVVLVVLMLIFTGKTGNIGRGLSDCEGKGGACVPEGTTCPKNSLYSSAFDCSGGQRCCIGTPKACPTGECGTGEQCNNGYCYAQ